MNMWETFVAGIAPQHAPALVATLLAVGIALSGKLRLSRADSLRFPQMSGSGPAGSGPAGPAGSGPAGLAGSGPPGLADRWAAALLGVAAVVHLALPLGHRDGVWLTVGFLGSGAAFAWVAMRALEGRRWRRYAAPLLIATLIGYLVVAGTGREEPDQVGIATAVVELAALGLCLVPPRGPRRRRFARTAGSAATVLVTVVTGAVIWIGSFLAHAATDHDVTLDGDQAAAVGHEGGHEHAHDHAARAQAGVIMRPLAGHHPTAAQVRAADELAAATRRAMARYSDLKAALADGYKLPRPGTGPDVHLESKAYKNDGRVLDPAKPEMLVYAIGGGRAALLGVVFQMHDAGAPGPAPGGPVTRWHAHNVCLTALPPGFGIVTPFGSCPALSLSVTTPEMMHVWVVDNPGGWYAEGLDKDWVRRYLADHGRPIG